MKMTKMFIAAGIMLAGIGTTGAASAQRYDDGRYGRSSWVDQSRYYDRGDDRRYDRRDRGRHYGWDRGRGHGRDRCYQDWHHGRRVLICR